MHVMLRCALPVALALLAGSACTHVTPSPMQPPALAPGAVFETTRLEQAGDAGVHTWRIPALAVAGDGSLVAAFDARNDGPGDLPGDVDIVVRRSSDLGRSWMPAQRVVDYDGGRGGGDPSLLLDRQSGRLFLFFAYGPPGVGFFNSSSERTPDSASALHPYLVWSDDHGRSWQGPRNLIAEIKPAGAHGLFATSGHGIQLSAHSPAPGRLLQPYVWMDGKRRAHAANAISDDHGASWRMGADIGIDLDENKAVELEDGRVLQNIRAYAKGTTTRLLAYSDDGGEHYGPVRAEAQLPDPRNNADLIRAFPDAAPGTPEARMLLFVNTANPRERRDLRVRLSCDSGRSWPVSKLLHAGPAMYAAMARLPDGSYGVLYENGVNQGISYARFNLAWLGRC